MKHARFDTMTGQGMNAGFCICDGEAYAATKATLLVQLMAIFQIEDDETIDAYLERMYEEELYYYTEWEDEDDTHDQPTPDEILSARQAVFNQLSKH
jgi:hypothetical protein